MLSADNSAVEAEQLLRQIQEVESDVARLQRACESQQRCMRHMQAPLMHMRAQQTARAQRRAKSSSDSSGASTTPELFHAQMHVQTLTQVQAHGSAPLAAAHIAWHAADAAAVAGAASAATAAAPSGAAGAGVLLHVLLSNHSADSVATDPQWLQLLVQLRVQPFLGSSSAGSGGTHGQTHVLSFLAPFPTSRWDPRSTFQAALPVDPQLLTHAYAQVRVAMRVQRPDDGGPGGMPGFVDVLLGEWTLDALDLSTPVLTPSFAAHTSPAKRKRDAASDNGNAMDTTADEHPSKQAHTHAQGSVNQQAILGTAGGAERRMLQIPTMPLWGSVYSTPAWFAQHLPLPSPLSTPRSLLAPASFAIAFVVPLLLDSQWTRASGPILHAFLRMLVSSLLPAHALSFSEAALSALLPSDAFETQASKCGTSTRIRFTVRMHGDELVEWQLDAKTAPSHAPVLFVLRIRAPNGLLLASLRANVLHRLQKALSAGLGPVVPSPSSASSSLPSPAPVPPPLPSLGAAVSLRKAAPAESMCATPARLPAVREAHKWRMAYLRATHGRNGGESSMGAAQQATSRLAGVTPQMPPLCLHVQRLFKQLEDMRARLQEMSDTHGGAASSLSSLLQLYLASRSTPSPGDVDLAISSSHIGSLHTLLC